MTITVSSGKERIMFEKLKREMEMQNIRAYSLAKQANINPSDLYSALKGDRKMFRGWRMRIAKVLGVSEEVLFSESEAENNE